MRLMEMMQQGRLPAVRIFVRIIRRVRDWTCAEFCMRSGAILIRFAGKHGIFDGVRRRKRTDL